MGRKVGKGDETAAEYGDFWYLLLMEEILHQLIGSLSHFFTGFYTSQVVHDFVHQQYVRFLMCNGVTIQASPWIHAKLGRSAIFWLGDIPMKHTQRLRFLGRELKVQMVDWAPFDLF